MYRNKARRMNVLHGSLKNQREKILNNTSIKLTKKVLSEQKFLENFYLPLHIVDYLEYLLVRLIITADLDNTEQNQY